MRTGDESSYTFMDRAFNNEIDFLVEATLADFGKMNYRDGELLAAVTSCQNYL